MKKALSILLTAIMIISILCSFTVAPVMADTGIITITLKRDLATNGIYLQSNMAHNGQRLIIAQYRGDMLQWVNVTVVDNVEGYTCDTEICTDYLATDVFKGFLWDSLTAATPVLDSISAEASTIETPALWLDAADVSTVTVADGKVSNWADKSGNGRDVYQETAANQPVYEEGEYVYTNSTSTISFLENRSPFLMSNSYTMFMMAELDTAPSGSWQAITEGSTTSNNPAYCITSTLVQWRDKNKKQSTVSLPTGYWSTGKQLHVITDNKSTLGATVYRSDKNVVLTPTSYTNRSATGIDIFAIGARRHYKDANNPLYAQYPAKCKYREILVYLGELDDAKKMEIQKYLLDKWGLEPSISGGGNEGSGDGEETEPAGLTPDALTAVAVDPSSTTDTQNAYYYVPSVALDKTKEPVPLVVGLHSWSATYSDASASTFAGLAKKYGWAMIHPDFRGANDDPDAGASDLAVDDVVRAVEFMQANANIDPNRIYLVGASGGGHMTLSVVSRRPDIWAAASAWVPITDLAQWYNFSKSKGSKYYSMIAKCCGGAPGDSEAVDAEYFLRSPINHLQNAINIPLDINTGIHDGHTGSVPISHSLWAFNKLAQSNGNTDKMLTDEQIAYMVDNEAIPEGLVTEEVDLTAEGRGYAVHFRRTAGNARVTVFEGGHTAEFGAAFKFFEDKVKSSN